MVRWSTWIVGFVVLVCAPGSAAASWYFTVKDPDGFHVLGPFETETVCVENRDTLVVAREKAFEDTSQARIDPCYYDDRDEGEDDGDGWDDEGDSDGAAGAATDDRGLAESDGGSGGDGGDGGDDRDRHELRLYAAARVPVFGRSIKTGQTMAGFTPEMITAGATSDAGLDISVRFSYRRWSSGYLQAAYVRDGFSYMGTSLGTINGGVVQGGYQRGWGTGGRCGGQISFGYGLRFSSFSASDANTELADRSMESVHLLADTRLLLSCRLTDGGMWLDAGLGAFYSPYRFEDPEVGEGDPNLYIELPAFGATAGLGVTFVL